MSKKEKKKEKTPVRKPKYSLRYCIKWLAARIWAWDKSLVLACIAVVPLALILYAAGLYIPPKILESIQTSDNFQTVALTVAVLLVTQLFFRILKDYIDIIRENAIQKNANRFYYELSKKHATADMKLRFEKEYNDRLQRAWDLLSNGVNNSPANFVIDFANVTVNILCFFMFGSVISTLNPLVIALLILLSLASIIPTRHQQNKNYNDIDAWNNAYKKINYLIWNASSDFRPAKDIRVYNMVPFIEERIADTLKERIKLLHRRQINGLFPVISGFLITVIREGAAYGVLMLAAAKGEVSAPEFVLYFSAISQMSGFINGIVGYFNRAHDVVLKTSDCIEHLDENFNTLNHGKGIPVPKGRPVSIEFKNVTFKYPQGEKNVLENISFKINAGEKISLVGMNGAGKTTLTYLMCGLLLPDEGEVLIDGHGVLEYNCGELYSLFSLTPQNYSVFPTSIAENIAFCDRSEIDEEKLRHCIEVAGLAEKLVTLPKGIDTGMDKRYDDDAVQLSGGEMQKLLLARALYHKSSVLILDEPTAALDPIAEDKMYRKYNDISDGTTSVFISHRLASARFCNTIFMLDGAHIVESGSHDELMAKNGKYRELFDIQSKYYKEGVENDG